MNFTSYILPLLLFAGCQPDTKTREANGYDLGDGSDGGVDASGQGDVALDQPDLPQTDPGLGVIGGLVTGGEGYFEPTQLQTEAFGDGGALLVVNHRGPVTLPTLNGEILSDGPTDDDVTLAIWVDNDAQIQRVVRLATGRTNVQLFALNARVAIAVYAFPGAVVLPDAEALTATTLSSHIFTASRERSVDYHATLTSPAGSDMVSAIAEGPGFLYIAGKSSGGNDQRLSDADGNVLARASGTKSAEELATWIQDSLATSP